ncbi:hypothetical protein CR513_30349, partial [Mucuna pruriens]
MTGSSSDERSLGSLERRLPCPKYIVEQAILSAQRARLNALIGHTTVREVKDKDEMEGWRKYLVERDNRKAMNRNPTLYEEGEMTIPLIVHMQRSIEELQWTLSNIIFPLSMEKEMLKPT